MLIERKLQNRDNPLDMKIHNEYLHIIGFNDYHYLEDQVKFPLNQKTYYNLLQNHISKRNKISRFKKWYRMAFMDNTNKYLITQEVNSTNSKNYKTDSFKNTHFQNFSNCHMNLNDSITSMDFV